MKEGSSFDYGVYGEGERTFAELVNSLEKGTKPDEIKGLLFRKDGIIVKTKHRSFEQNIDAFSFPDRKLLDPNKYLWSVPGKGIVRFTTLMTSRGCPFHCIFCSQRTIFGTEVRYRSSQKVLDEIEWVVKFLKIRHFSFLDETLTLNKDHVKKICQGIIERKLNITWEGWTRANTVNEELLELMKKSGFVRISFGIESANQKIREIIKKGVKLDDYIKAYKIAKKLGIETRASLIIGNPYETKKTILESFKFVKRIKECDQLYLNISTPYPGTELYEMAKKGKGGIRLLTNDFSQYKRYGDSVIEVNDLTRKDLVNLQKKGFLMFYLTPRRIWYNLKRAGFKAGIQNAFAFLKSMISF